jgi:hypothetical protein
MLAVLLLFLIPVGGGIPAGVLLGTTKGLPWEVVAGLYFVSDVILALAFEPLLRGFVLLARHVPFLARVGAAMKESMARSAATFAPGAGPIALIMIAFGVEPMTGRSAALAAGHGFVTGWALAIAGDMLYYGVIAVSTLRLNTFIKNPNTTMWIILGAMFVVPMVVRRIRAGIARRRGAAA